MKVAAEITLMIRTADSAASGTQTHCSLAWLAYSNLVEMWAKLWACGSDSCSGLICEISAKFTPMSNVSQRSSSWKAIDIALGHCTSVLVLSS